MNMALLAKLGWRLIEENDKLWARVIHGKYLKSQDLLSATPSKTMSHGWRSILAGREVLVKGLKWRLGTGNTVSFWKDKWLANVRLIDTAIIPVDEAEANKTVDHYYDDDGWNVEKLSAFLHPDVESTIHILRDCHAAKEIWIKLLGTDPNSLFFTCTVDDWWKINLIQQKNKVFGSCPWRTLFAATCWNLWKWRNELSISSKSTSITSKMIIINKSAKEFVDLSGKVDPGKLRTEVQLSWDKPPEGWVKLNTDSSWN
ncbi:hypothetical protein COLO4_14116 [Corchorus olitorius]|uniref:Reverse transcriptase zinc-binding domain-containing protein n=1 Tax=Corchorus olitorius TaxID=93759 RepID=A0A1R3JTE6_9ROSI|nr:hypothetical protein COLO4_14116 [Corchorus olitorius]